MRRSRGVLLALVVCVMVLAACDLFQGEEPAMATAAPMMGDRETATPVGTEELFFGEVSGFTPPPPMGGGGSIAPATTRQAGDGEDTSVQEPSRLSYPDTMGPGHRRRGSSNQIQLPERGCDRHTSGQRIRTSKGVNGTIDRWLSSFMKLRST